MMHCTAQATPAKEVPEYLPVWKIGRGERKEEKNVASVFLQAATPVKKITGNIFVAIPGYWCTYRKRMLTGHKQGHH